MASRNFLSDIKLSNEATLVFEDSGSNTISISAPTTVTSTYSLVLPAATPADGEILEWNSGSSAFIWSTPSVGSTTFDGLTDTNITGPIAATELLAWSGSAWRNRTFSQAGVAISSRNLNAGNGLSGGGNLTADRTFTVDLNELTTETSIDSGDFITMVDITDSGSGKITFANLQTSITSLGTIATGIWEATDIAILHGGTGASTAQAAIDNLAGLTTEGDILFENGSGNVIRLGRGSTGQVLTATASTIEWAAAGGGGGTTIDALTDTTITGPATDDLLVWDGVSAWVDKSFSEAGIVAVGGAFHDGFSDFVGNEHIDHTSVTITAGTGLSYSSGGTDISASATIIVSGLTVTEFTSQDISQWTNDSNYYSSGDVILADDGAVTAPGFSFADQTDMGLYRISQGNLGIVANGVLAIQIQQLDISPKPSILMDNITNFSITADNNTIVKSGKWVIEHETTTIGGILQLNEGTVNGTNSVKLKAAGDISSTMNWFLPDVSVAGGFWKSSATGGSSTLTCELITEADISGFGTYFDTAGTGLTSSSNTVNVIASANSGIAVAADSIKLDINDLSTATIAGGDFIPFWDITATADNKKMTFTNFQAQITSLGTIATGVWNGTTIAVANGGTGDTSLTAGTEYTEAAATVKGHLEGIDTALGLRYEEGDVILASSGTVSLPGISFSGKTDTGIYSSTSNRVDFSVQGVNIMSLYRQSGVFNVALLDTDIFSISASVSWVVQTAEAAFGNTSANTTLPGLITIREALDNGTHTIGLTVPASVASDVNWTLPPTINDNGVWKSDGSGVLLCEKVDFSELTGVAETKAIGIESPTASEDITMFFTDDAITIIQMNAVLRGSGSQSVTWTIRHNSDRSAAGAEVVTSGTTTTSITTGSEVTSFNDATIPAGSWVWLETTAMVATVDEINITIEFTKDD